jgi:iron complex transport system permease protein
LIRDSEGIEDYENLIRKKRLIILALLILSFFLVALSLTIGSTHIPVSDIIKGIFGIGEKSTLIKIWEHRMPRVLGGLVAGAGLAVAGCVMQNNLKNPLASPSTMGISAAAVFGANFAIIVLGAGVSSSHYTADFVIKNPYAVTIMAFVMAIITMSVVVVLSKKKNFAPAATVLAGVAMGSIFSAGTMIVQYFSTDTSLATAVFWSFGDLGKISWKELSVLTAVVAVCSVFFYLMRWNYNALANGDEVAKSLGVRVDKLVMAGLVLSSLITALCVSFMGVIGFIGLVGPQISRRLVGEDHRFLIPASMAMGAVTLMLSDLVARTVIAPVTLPVGAVTALIGGPMFLYLLMRGESSKC